jgi:hypothetical protein
VIAAVLIAAVVRAQATAITVKSHLRNTVTEVEAIVAIGKTKRGVKKRRIARSTIARNMTAKRRSQRKARSTSPRKIARR